MSSQNCLPSNSYEGQIGQINFRWSESGRNNIQKGPSDYKAPVATFKAVTEHFVYDSAVRLGAVKVTIKQVISLPY